MPFKFQNLKIPDVILVEPEVFWDTRGFFLETYKQSEFARHGIPDTFVQDNHSHSGQGVLRGLHYQKEPMAQAKLVRVIAGEIFDVAVDIRKGSPTYGEWVAEKLSSENKKILYVPEGFAHGFCVLSKTVEVVYKNSREYSPLHEAGILWSDPGINIEWPFRGPYVSKKDAGYPLLKDIQTPFLYEK